MSKIFAYKPSAYKEDKAYLVIPSGADKFFNFTRPAAADRIDPDGDIESMAINVPRIDYSDEGCPKLLLDNSLTERCFVATPLDINPNTMVWSVELSATSDSGTVRSVAMTDLTNSIVSIGYTATDGQILSEFINNGSTVSSLTYDNCDVTLFRGISTRKEGDVVELKIDGVLVGYTEGATTLPNTVEISYSLVNTGDYMDGKTRDNYVDDDVDTFNSTAKSYGEIDLIINNYTTR